MENRISISDYNADWAYIENFQHPRSHKGYLTRENVVSFYGTLGVDGVEYTHSYWEDCPASYARRVAENAGLPVVCYYTGCRNALPIGCEGDASPIRITLRLLQAAEAPALEDGRISSYSVDRFRSRSDFGLTRGPLE